MPLEPEGLADWDRCTVDAGRPGALVGARDGVGLPRPDPGLPHRRGRPSDHRRDHRDLVRPRGGRTARGRLLHRPARVRGRPGLHGHPATARGPRRRRGPRRWSGGCSRTPRSTAPIPGTPGGAGPRSPPPTVTATPVRWPWSSPIVAGGGEARGVRLLSEKGCDAIFDEQSDRRDLVLRAALPVRHGLRVEHRLHAHRAPGLLLGRLTGDRSSSWTRTPG